MKAQPLADLCELIVDSEHKTAPKIPGAGGHPLVRTSDLVSGAIDFRKAQRISEETYLSWTRRATPSANDIILSREAPVGNVGLVTPGSKPALGQRTVLLRPNRESVHPTYLLALLLSPALQYRIHGIANGSTVPHLNMADLRRLPIPELPSLRHQTIVGTILNRFYELIENNRRRIEGLEEMARLLYREWFVHFRFPGHEDVELVDSDLGPIPQGWSASKIEEVATVVRGRSYRRADLEEPGLPFLNLKCVKRGGGFRPDGIKSYSGRYKDEQRAFPGDVVVAVTDMTQQRLIVGQAALVPELPEEFGVISLDLARVVPTPPMPNAYLFGLLAYTAFSRTIREFANGTNVLHLSPDRIREHKLIVAPPKLQKQCTTLLMPNFELIENLTKQNRVLAQARDLLLPGLVSGQIDVSELDFTDLESATATGKDTTTDTAQTAKDSE